MRDENGLKKKATGQGGKRKKGEEAGDRGGEMKLDT